MPTVLHIRALRRHQRRYGCRPLPRLQQLLRFFQRGTGGYRALRSARSVRHPRPLLVSRRRCRNAHRGFHTKPSDGPWTARIHARLERPHVRVCHRCRCGDHLPLWWHSARVVSSDTHRVRAGLRWKSRVSMAFPDTVHSGGSGASSCDRVDGLWNRRSPPPSGPTHALRRCWRDRPHPPCRSLNDHPHPSWSVPLAERRPCPIGSDHRNPQRHPSLRLMAARRAPGFMLDALKRLRASPS